MLQHTALRARVLEMALNLIHDARTGRTDAPEVLFTRAEWLATYKLGRNTPEGQKVLGMLGGAR